MRVIESLTKEPLKVMRVTDKRNVKSDTQFSLNMPTLQVERYIINSIQFNLFIHNFWPAAHNIHTYSDLHIEEW